MLPVFAQRRKRCALPERRFRRMWRSCLPTPRSTAKPNPTWYKDDASVPSAAASSSIPSPANYQPVLYGGGRHLARRDQEGEGRRQEEPRRLRDRPGRWSCRDRAALEDERAGRRHRQSDHADAQAVERDRQQLRGLRHHGRLGQLLRRRESDATTARHSGRGVGRGRDGRPRASRT